MERGDNFITVLLFFQTGSDIVPLSEPRFLKLLKPAIMKAGFKFTE